jgi:hypothetical protein
MRIVNFPANTKRRGYAFFCHAEVNLTLEFSGGEVRRSMGVPLAELCPAQTILADFPFPYESVLNQMQAA